MKHGFVSGIILAALALGGCSAVPFPSCPYRVAENPRVCLGGAGAPYQLAGVHVPFSNERDLAAVGVTVSFSVYDKDGANPLPGSNAIVESAAVDIAPHSAAEVVFSLDPYLDGAPDEPYQVDYFYVREIRYADGSVWSDPFGMYAPQARFE